ncbi:CARDB domain-containing protein [Humisphaera borealis]|uniref:C-type lectin domain-containing protein n=1 Tax=Humisphaera borealis TaxID=2807512 RepID=A0A7M2WQR0_9BACT|nr:CARDB domain-containing protein [Humisphaera borealis]QOV87838.1 hypothetical protein IPV69_16285 [Humisphaera borealis]
MASVESLESRRLFAANPAVLATFVNPANGHTYKLLDAATWDEAQDKAVALGGNLVTVNDAAEHNYVWGTFSGTASLFWIGYNDADRDGVYRWVSGEPATYTNWHAGEPNSLWDPGEVWGTMWSDYGGEWNDLGVESFQGSVHKSVVEIATGADLFASLSTAPPAAEPGASFAVTATVRNGGSSTVTTPVAVQFYLSSDATFDDGVDILVGSAVTDGSALAFNGSASAGTSATVPQTAAPGRYYLIGVVDPANLVAEGDEANNVVAGGIIDVGATRTPVLRNLVGYVRDGVGGALNGVRVDYDGKTVFTDYDKGRRLDSEINGDFIVFKAVVGYNVSFNGAFSHFRPTDVTEKPLVLTAKDLAGNTYTNTIGVGNVIAFDPAQVDGAVGPFIATRVLFLGDYTLTDSAGAILLHKDLRNDRNSIHPTYKSPPQLAAGRRFKDTVETALEKLSALGYCEPDGSPLVAVTALTKGSSAVSAVQLFNDIATGYAAADPTTKAKSKAPAGVIDEAFINRLNGLVTTTHGWTASLPSGWTAAAGLADTWVNRTVFLRMTSLASAVPGVSTWTLSKASPATGGTTSIGFPAGVGRAGADIAFGWINTSGVSIAGTTFWEPIGGATLETVKRIGGKKLAIPDPRELGVTWAYRADYDAVATQAAITALLDGGNVRVAYNDPQILTALNAVSINGAKVKLLRADLTPAAGYDTQVGARVK